MRDAIQAGIPSGRRSTRSTSRDKAIRGSRSSNTTSAGTPKPTSPSRARTPTTPVRLSNDFFDANRSRRRLALTARTTGDVVKSVKTRELWEQIGVAAWQCADPGVQYDDTIKNGTRARTTTASMQQPLRHRRHAGRYGRRAATDRSLVGKAAFVVGGDGKPHFVEPSSRRELSPSFG